MEGPREKRRKQAHPQRKHVLQYDVTLEAGPGSDSDDATNVVGGASGVPSPRQRPDSRTWDTTGDRRSLEALNLGLGLHPGLDPGLDPELEPVFRQSLENTTDTAVIYPESPERAADYAEEESALLLLCPLCEQGFRKLSALKEHVSLSHRVYNQKNHQDLLQDHQDLPQNLQNHQDLKNLQDHSPNCEDGLYREQNHVTCSEWTSSLQTPPLTDVTGNRKFKCSECGKAFKYKHHLKEHLRIHSGEKPYECSNCKKRFSHSGSYSSHISSRKCTSVNHSANPANTNSANHPRSSAHVQTRPDPPDFTNQGFVKSTQNGFGLRDHGLQSALSLGPSAYGGHKMAASQQDKLRAHLKELGAMMEDAGFQTEEGTKTLTEDVRPDLELNSFSCRFCTESFLGPIPLHQHERYLCHKNEAIKKALNPRENPKTLTSEQLSLFNLAVGSEPSCEDVLRFSLALGLPPETVREWVLQHKGPNTEGTCEKSVRRFKSVNGLFTVDSSVSRRSSPNVVKKAGPGEKLSETMDLNRNNPETRSSSPSPLNLSGSIKTSEDPNMDFPLDLSMPKALRPALGPRFGPGFGPSLGLGVPALELQRYSRTTAVYPGFLGPFPGSSPGFLGTLAGSGIGAYHTMEFMSGVFTDLQQKRKYQRHPGAQGKGVDDSADLLLDQSDDSIRRKDSGSYNCDLCHKTFQKTSSLLRHRYEHTGKRPHQCSVCQKAFKHKHHLLEHSRLHSGEKPYVCDRCGKRFSHSGSYSQHMNHRYAYCKRDQNLQNPGQKDQGEKIHQQVQREERDEQHLNHRYAYCKWEPDLPDLDQNLQNQKELNVNQHRPDPDLRDWDQDKDPSITTGPRGDPHEFEEDHRENTQNDKEEVNGREEQTRNKEGTERITWD